MQYIATANHLASTNTFPEIFLFDRADGVDVDSVVDRQTLKAIATQARGIVGISSINGVGGRNSGLYYMTNFKYLGGSAFSTKIDSPQVGAANLSSGVYTATGATPYAPAFCSMVPKALQADTGSIAVTFPEFGMKVAYNNNGNSFSNMTIMRGAVSQVTSVYSDLSGVYESYVYRRPTANITVNGQDTYITGVEGGHTATGYGGRWAQRAAPVNCYVAQAGDDERPTITDAIISPTSNLIFKFSANELLIAGEVSPQLVPGTHPSFAINAASIVDL